MGTGVLRVRSKGAAAGYHRAAVRALVPLLVAALLTCPRPVEAGPEVSVLETPGVGSLEELDRALARLSTHRRLLILAAHPDDEDTRTLARVARGDGGEAVYLSLSRGEGGQNLIGDELGEALGVLRSRELEAARAIDGARQRFARTYDFGYTRSLEETLERWPLEVLLEDAMRVVRRERPQVLVAIFPPTARAGHGQHQASGLVAAEVFERSSAPDAFPALDEEGLPAWSVSSFWRTTWWDPAATTLELPLGEIEPHTGRSLYQIALAARSQHRCQDMGVVPVLGDASAALGWAAGAGGPEADDLFAGIDTRLEAISADLGDPVLEAAVSARLRRVDELARGARAALGGQNRFAAARPMFEIVDLLRRAERDLAEASTSPSEKTPGVVHARALVAEKRRIAEAAFPPAVGLALDAVTDREAWTPGAEGLVQLQWWNAGSAEVVVDGLALEGWEDRGDVEPPEPERGLFVFRGEPTGERWRSVAVPEDARPTEPWFLERPRRADLYDWSSAPREAWHLPFGDPPLVARFDLRVDGLPVTVRREVVFRERDQAVGEVRRPVRVVPEVEVEVRTPLRVVPEGTAPRPVPVVLRSRAAEERSVHLAAVAEHGSASGGIDLVLAAGERREVSVDLPPPRPGRSVVAFEASTPDGSVFTASYPLVDHPHVRPTPWRREAEVAVVAGEIRWPALDRIGFVVGASEAVPESLAEAGLPIERLDRSALLEGDLSRYPAIVVGSRAYETRPELAEANARLLDWVRAGGTLLVQYQQYQFALGGFAPHALSIARPHDRITDENAPIRVLEPDHPVFRHPHRIGREDWLGWVQERGLYFASEWSDAYTPLVAMRDPGREEITGGLLVTDLGEGTWIYTGLAFFRQLPAGVPGAWRLFLNLLALGEKR